MARPKRDQLMRHETFTETFTDDDEEGFIPIRDSGVVVNPGLPTESQAKRGKGKRSIEDMMASMPNAPAQSVYALERIASLEDQIVKVLALCSKEARAIVLSQRPTLRRYMPEE